MKLYLGNLSMGDVPGVERKAGELFPRLVALRIEVSNDGNWLDYEPIYIPLLRVQRRAGQVIIEINTTRPWAYITLQWRTPYVHIFYFPWWLWDKENL